MYRVSFWQSWAILSVEGGDPGVLIRLPKSPLCTTSVRRILCADLWQHVTVFPDGCTYPCGGVSIEGLESGAMKSLNSQSENHSLYSKFRKTLIVRHTCFCMFTFCCSYSQVPFDSMDAISWRVAAPLGYVWDFAAADFLYRRQERCRAARNESKIPHVSKSCLARSLAFVMADQKTAQWHFEPER